MASHWRILIAIAFAAGCSRAQTAVPQFLIGTAAGGPPASGNGGPATSALLRQPEFVAVDASGNVYTGEFWGFAIRKVTGGNIGTVIGTGFYGATPDGPNASTGAIAQATGLTFDSAGNLYFVDDGIRVRKLSASGVLTTVAGTINAGFGGDGGLATAARFNGIKGIAFDAAGNLYIADSANHVVRKVGANGIVNTFAGTPGISGFAGDQGPATAALLNAPNDVAADSFGTLFIADRNNNRIRRVAPDGTIFTYAGNGSLGAAGDGGPAANAQLTQPQGLAIDAEGNLFVTTGSRVRLIVPGPASDTIQLVAGTTSGYSGDGGAAVTAQLASPIGVTVDSNGNVYIADGNQCIREVTRAGIITTFAGAGHFAGDNGQAAAALVSFPSSVAVDSSGNVFIADSGNNRIRQIGANGVIRTVAGNGIPGFSGDGGAALSASLQSPQAVAVDGLGNLYIADTGNQRVRVVNAAGMISTIAGSGLASSGVDGPALQSPLNGPLGLATDSRGSLYIADTNNNQIRLVIPQVASISTIAGTGSPGLSGDGGAAKSATLNHPQGIAFDAAGNLYIADHNNFRVRKFDTKGNITTVAGSVQGNSGLGGAATSAAMGHISSVAVDAAGDLLIADPQNGQILLVTLAGTISKIAGGGAYTYTGDGGLALQATFGEPEAPPGGIAAGPGGTVYFTDYANDSLRQLTPILPAQLSIVSGNNQPVTAGSAAPALLVVAVQSSTGLPVAGVTVTFAVTSGSATLSANSVVTTSTGQASVSVTPSAAGAVTVTASVAGLAPVTFKLNATASTAPQISTGGLVGAGLSTPAVTALSANAIVSIFGQNFAAPGSAAVTPTESNLVGGALPTQLAGVCVAVNSVPSPMLLVSPTQLNIQVPAIPQSGTVAVQVMVNCGQSAQTSSAAVSVSTQAATPEFFFFAHNANGQNPVAAVNAVTGAYVAPANLIAGVTTSPAHPGDIVSVFMTGLGPTNPATVPGVLPQAAAALTLPVTVVLGTATLPAANLLYAGVTPQNAGLYQLNIQVPSNTPVGSLPLSVNVGGFATPAGGYLSIGQ